MNLYDLLSRSSVCPSIRLSCVAKNLKVGHYAQNFQPNSSTLAMLTGIVDCNHGTCILLPVALTLAGDHKISEKQNMLAVFFCLFCFCFLSCFVLFCAHL